ncbi:hypothetical protein A6A06_17340 [Streptomyces sp. CB02923]|uniref:sigma factor n=1 Tax=Streptomyces sp. CB02923 TaxID=1718985 RepID=UPI0009397E76|nr:sigma factor [Streptomyces sp. CB02923]OKI00706.1 hypothetical protein A6A06_17340 [Streptomyces sp. CB02923]
MSEVSAESPASAADDYTRLYEREHPRLVAYARSLTTSAWLAEDLVAEAHFRVWRRIRSGHRIDNVPAYLRTTIRHLASAVGAAAAREIPQDPEDGPAWPGTGPAWPGSSPAAEQADPAQRVAYVDLLARVMGRLPQRWVTALWLAEAEDQPLEEVGRAIGAGKGATAVLLHRAREGMRQAFLGSVPGTPDDPACEVHWRRMPAFVRGEATAKQADGVAGHLAGCPDCRARMALLTRANDRLPALTGPALLVLLAGGSAKFLLPLAGAGAAAAGGHAAGSGAAASVQHALTSVPRSVRQLLRGQIGQAGPVAATVAGVGVAVVAGVAVAAGVALTGGDASPAAERTAAAPGESGSGGAGRAAPDATADRSATSAPTGAPDAPPAPAARGTASAPPAPRAGAPAASQAPAPSASQAPAPSGTGRPGPTPAPTGPATSPGPDPTASAPTGGPTRPTAVPTPVPTGSPTARPTPTPTPSPTITPTITPTPTPTPTPSPSEHCHWGWWGWGPVWICRTG